MFTLDSKMREIYEHPVGRDILRKILLQTGHSYKLVKNLIIGSIKLKLLPKLTIGRIDCKFLSVLLELLNSEPDRPLSDTCNAEPAWWKEAVFYQIYPQSFKDSNGDGIGDLRGIIEKLDCLKLLGVDVIWLSPVYDSPLDDNGYDIRDYRKILCTFGTMEDFDELLAAVHARGMRLIMDLVVNHTSDEHDWFKKAVQEPDSQYGDYYFFREKPNNWTSFFSGSAWKYIEERSQYALHLFSEKQMDLNWESPLVRKEVAETVRWWLEKGVDGFRMDVINYISKRNGLPEGNESIAKLIGYCGVEHYFYGPHLHEYLRELKKEAFEPYKAFSVGETPGVGIEMSRLLTADYRKELDMVFTFDHLETPGHVRFDDYKYDLNFYKNYVIDYLGNYDCHCQPSLFFENHDNPRMISKVDPDPQYTDALAKLLALMQLTLRGTPFIYQGQELGMSNNSFNSIDELRDVESLNLYAELCKTMDEKDAFRKVLAGSRDHARTPMQWSNEKYAGFSTEEPWIGLNSNYSICNAEAQMMDDRSVWSFYRKLIALRKSHSSLIYGDISFTNISKKNLFTFWRTNAAERLFVQCNLSADPIKGDVISGGICLITNYPDLPGPELRPYEASVWRFNDAT